MPLYEYYCADCRGKFELLVSYAASESNVECTKCHGMKVRKLVSIFARTSRGGSDGFADFGSDDGDGGEYGDDGLGGGGCSCGGACSCGH